jgi:two-component system, cell cycle response regulator
MRTGDLAGEIRELRARIATLMEEASANERLLKKNQTRELDLLRAEKLTDLFQATCAGLQRSYGLEATSLVLQDPEHEIQHLLLADGVSIEQLPNVLFVDALEGVAPQFNLLQRPWLGPYMGHDHQRLFPGRSDLGSVALIPMRRHDQLIGSLNFGSADAKRFNRHLATDFLGQLGVIAAFALENAVNRARLVRSGLTDFLTGWHNRRYLHERLKEELARAQRQDTNVTCLVIDLDRFKLINDQYGHLVGDMALREAARRINREIRGSDAAARFGGDEFVLLAPGMSAEQAQVLAERIRRGVADIPLEIAPGQQHLMSVSIGVASVVPQRTSDLELLSEELLGAADQALYRAKEKGRNRVEVAAS